jgi:integrase
LRALTDDEFSRAVEHVSHRFALIVSVTYETGLRIGEVLGRTWQKVDLDRETVEVSAQLDPKGKTIRKTKTKQVRTTRSRRKRRACFATIAPVWSGRDNAVDETVLVFVTARGLPQSRRNALQRRSPAQSELARGWWWRVGSGSGVEHRIRIVFVRD